MRTVPTAPETLPGHSPGRVSSFRPVTIAVLSLVVALLAAIGFDRWSDNLAMENARGAIVGRLAPRRTSLQYAINQGFSMLPGLGSFVALNWARPDFDSLFDTYSEKLHLLPSDGVRTLQVVFDGRIVHLWPKKGNEGAIRRDPMRDPRPMIRNDFRRALHDSTYGVTLSGPLRLYQGGEGLIGRQLVDVPPGVGPLVVAAVLDIQAVIRESGLNDTTSVRWAVRDQDGRRIAGEADSTMVRLDPVSLAVRLSDRSWLIEAAPLEGWDTLVGPKRLTRRLALAIVVGLVSALGYLFQSRLSARIESANLRELREAEEHFALLFQLVPDGVALVDVMTDEFVQVNDAYCAITGRTKNELIGHTHAQLGLWADPTERVQHLATLESSPHREALDQPCTIARPDGEKRETLVSARVIDLEDRPHRLIVVRDVHARRDLERRLVASQRLEAIGRLAGGVAHDFNNLITAIGGYARIALDATAAADPRRRDLVEIQAASARAADLTRQLLTFARRQVVLPRRVDLVALTLGLEPLLTRLLGGTGRVVFQTSETAVPILADPSQIEHAILNLVVNARDAVPEGASITVRAMAEDGMAILEVEDSGVGIDPAALPHLFEPFYTTKPVGQGTGLGLATVYGIVEQSGGTIQVESERGKGTRVIIRLPLSDLTELDVVASAHRELPRGSEHILVVDDEPQIRDICQRLLTQLGYTVTVTSEGSQALGLLTGPSSTPVHLVLSDLLMPGMGGLELRRELARCAPDLPVILMSGYSQEALTMDEGIGDFLPKPFTVEELARAIRVRLGSKIVA